MKSFIGLTRVDFLSIYIGISRNYRIFRLIMSFTLSFQIFNEGAP